MSAQPQPGPGGACRLVLSIPEAAAALGVSDDLVYELTHRGELPHLRLGRRVVIPVRAIEALVDACVAGFDADETARRFAQPG